MVRMNESHLKVVAETDTGYGQLLSILMRRRRWLIGVAAGVLSLATLLTLIAKPTYESSMQLLVEPNYQGKREGKAESEFADSSVQVDYATQLNVMRSPLLIQQAVDLLRPDYPTLTVKEIKKSLLLSQVMEEKVNTKIVKAVYTDHDPIKAQKVLNALNTVYQVYNRNQQQQRLNKGLEFINVQLPQVKQDVQRAEAKLERFRKKQNLIDPGQQASATAATLNSIKQERQSLRAQYKDYQAREIALQQKIGRSPQDALISSRLSQSGRYQTLLNEFQRTELALAQLRARFTDQDPKVQTLTEQSNRQRDLLQNEVKRVLGNESAQLKNTPQGFLGQGQLGGIDLNLTSQLVEVQTNLRALLARDQSLAETEQKLTKELNRFPDLLSEYNQLQPEVQVNRDKLEQLLKARQDLSLELARGGFVWQSLEQPKLGLKIGPNLERNLLLGLVAGLMLGGVAAFVREMVDDAVHNSEELEKQVELPLLGMTPELPKGKASEPVIKLPYGKPQLLTPWTIEVGNWPPSWESLDLIYKNIELLNSVSSFKSLMITSALAGEGKSSLALGLALSAARLHQRVLLIDADLRRPSLHKQLNLPNEQGLSTLLTVDANLPNHTSVQSSEDSFIDILTAGPTPEDPAKLLSSQRMRQLMAAFEQKYDLVLLDAPPVLGLVDAILAGSFCSGVVLVSRIGQVTRKEVMHAKAMLSKLNLIGVVANGESGPTSGYYMPYTRPNGVVLQQSMAK